MHGWRAQHATARLVFCSAKLVRSIDRQLRTKCFEKTQHIAVLL